MELDFNSLQNDLLDRLNFYISSNDLLAQTDGDENDAAQREGMLLLANWFYKVPLNAHIDVIQRFESVVAPKLISSEGKLRRTSKASQWGSKWDRGSRDQYHIIIGMGVARQYPLLNLMFKDHLKRLLLFTTNTRPNTSENAKWKLPDLTGPGFWAIWIRALCKSKKWAPILALMDFSMLANSLIWRFYHLKFNKDHTDILNHVQVMVQSKLTIDTPVARLARFLLKDAPINEMFDDYFHPRTNGIYEMAKIYKPIVNWVQEK